MRAKVYIDDVMDVTGETSLDEKTGVVEIIEERTGKQIIIHITKCVIKEL